MSNFRTIITEADVVELARVVCVSVSDGDGDRMLIVGLEPLSATGELPATHYISSGYISQTLADVLPLTTYVDQEGVWVVESETAGNAQMAVDIATGKEVPLTLEEAESVFFGSDVTEQIPDTAMGRMGLKLVTVSEEE